MRGKDGADTKPFVSVRITPAYAGKSLIMWATLSARWDHPRLCGEKRTALTYWRDLGGSPPPMRGKVCPAKKRYIVLGITPAYAGKSYRQIFSKTSYGDHPRLCGEKFFGMTVQERDAGSPPPMRGKAGKIFRRVCPVGITPAYAGKRAE